MSSNLNEKYGRFVEEIMTVIKYWWRFDLGWRTEHVLTSFSYNSIQCCHFINKMISFPMRFAVRVKSRVHVNIYGENRNVSISSTTRWLTSWKFECDFVYFHHYSINIESFGRYDVKIRNRLNIVFNSSCSNWNMKVMHIKNIWH